MVIEPQPTFLIDCSDSDFTSHRLRQQQATGNPSKGFLSLPPYTVHIAAKHAQIEISARNLIIFPLNLESTRAEVGNLMTHFVTYGFWFASSQLRFLRARFISVMFFCSYYLWATM